MIHHRECANNRGNCEHSEGNILGLWTVYFFLFCSLAPGSTGGSLSDTATLEKQHRAAAV